MDQRIDAQASVMARTRIAERAGRCRDREPMDAGDEHIGDKAQPERLERIIDHALGPQNLSSSGLTERSSNHRTLEWADTRRWSEARA
jgi:hypothetical protein